MEANPQQRLSIYRARLSVQVQSCAVIKYYLPNCGLLMQVASYRRFLTNPVNTCYLYASHMIPPPKILFGKAEYMYPCGKRFVCLLIHGAHMPYKSRRCSHNVSSAAQKGEDQYAGRRASSLQARRKAALDALAVGRQPQRKVRGRRRKFRWFPVPQY